ncbi:hypothetical protein MKZ38_007588 [Zalerion maritima]|uniref:Uncharacterized protein n=1 Tax=Zalerion maritima TaxID=339359 RepID=A0AAD5RUT6_9PEZI|nr:hypothetical protein MKZ38_007588 [Zalerion maritima]
MFNLEHVLNEAACLLSLAENADLPLLKVFACFEGDSAADLTAEYVDGVGMDHLRTEKQEVVVRELQAHMETTKKLKSNIWGGSGGMDLGWAVKVDIYVTGGATSLSSNEEIQRQVVEDAAEGDARPCVRPQRLFGQFLRRHS